MFSIAVSSSQPLDTISVNGYRLTTAKSNDGIPRSKICFWCSVEFVDKRPPYILGCSVLTRPPSISGNCVNSDTSDILSCLDTFNRLRICLYVPPDEKIL